jgi:hypothetical protein
VRKIKAEFVAWPLESWRNLPRPNAEPRLGGLARTTLSDKYSKRRRRRRRTASATSRLATRYPAANKDTSVSTGPPPRAVKSIMARVSHWGPAAACRSAPLRIWTRSQLSSASLRPLATWDAMKRNPNTATAAKRNARGVEVSRTLLSAGVTPLLPCLHPRSIALVPAGP